MRIIDVWQGDWGQFEIPDDVPVGALRVDGWFDRRYGVAATLKRYFADMDGRMRDRLPILTWAGWTDLIRDADNKPGLICESFNAG